MIACLSLISRIAPLIRRGCDALLVHRSLRLAFPRFGGHYLKGGYDVQHANQSSR